MTTNIYVILPAGTILVAGGWEGAPSSKLTAPTLALTSNQHAYEKLFYIMALWDKQGGEVTTNLSVNYAPGKPQDFVNADSDREAWEKFGASLTEGLVPMME